MRLLFIGDVVGRSGRDALLARLPGLRRDLALDAVIVNGENAAAGFGVTEKICREFLDAGVDVVTTGNHVWDQRDLIAAIDREPRIVRPMNYPEGTPGRGATIVEVKGKGKLLVANVMCRLFMDPLDDPFAAVDRMLKQARLGVNVQAIVVDVHGEASSEKMALGHFMDGRASLVVGTHTHVPTADWQILPGGTAYQTDAGMSGDYDSVIGMRKEISIARFTRKMPTERMGPADGEATLCGLFVVTDDKTGLAARVEPLRVGGRLSQAMPTL